MSVRQIIWLLKPRCLRRGSLLHELSHLRSRDLWWNLLSRWCCALLWPQPLLWLVCRNLERTNEEVCDLAVVEAGCSPQQYARCLVDLAERLILDRAQRTVATGVVPRRSALAQRVQLILNESERGIMKISHFMRVAAVASTIAVTASVMNLIAVRQHAEASPLHPAKDKTAFITGRVVYEDGRPAAGVPVSLQPTDRAMISKDFQNWDRPRIEALQHLLRQSNGYTVAELKKKANDLDRDWGSADVTRSDGTFRLSGFNASAHNVIVDPERTSSDSSSILPTWVAASPTVVMPGAEKSTSISNIVLTHGAIIRGRVLDRSTGEPLANVHVYSHGPHRPRSGASVIGTRTNDTGDFAMRVAPGKSYVYISGNTDLVATVHYGKSSPYPEKQISVIKNGEVLYFPDSWHHVTLDKSFSRLQRIGPSSSLTEVATLKGQTRTLIMRLNRLSTKHAGGNLEVFIPGKPPVSKVSYTSLSSPEATVRSFVNTINSKNIQQAAACVEGGLPIVNPRLKKYGGLPYHYRVLSLQTQERGDNATVRIHANISPKWGNEKTTSRNELANIRLRRQNGNWKIARPYLDYSRNDQSTLQFQINQIAPLYREQLQQWAANRGTATVTGRAVFEDGSPAANITGVVSSESTLEVLKNLGGGPYTGNDNFPSRVHKLFWQSFITDKMGEFRIFGLTTSRYRFSLSSGRVKNGQYQPAQWILDEREAQFAAREGMSTRLPDLKLKLMRGASVTVRIVDRATGKALPQVEFSCASWRDKASQAISHGFITDDSGQCTFRFVPGLARISLRLSPGNNTNLIKTKGILYEVPSKSGRPVLNQRDPDSTSSVLVNLINHQSNKVVFRAQRFAGTNASSVLSTR